MVKQIVRILTIALFVTLSQGVDSRLASNLTRLKLKNCNKPLSKISNLNHPAGSFPKLHNALVYPITCPSFENDEEYINFLLSSSNGETSDPFVHFELSRMYNSLNLSAASHRELVLARQYSPSTKVLSNLFNSGLPEQALISYFSIHNINPFEACEELRSLHASDRSKSQLNLDGVCQKFR